MSNESTDEDRAESAVVGRRSWLGKVGLATGVAVVGSQLLPDAPAQAANGDPITAGNYTGSTGTTQLVDSNFETVFWSVANTSAGIPYSAAVVGDSSTMSGVAGLSNVGPAVVGMLGGTSNVSDNSAGVAGHATIDSGIGVLGGASGASSIGVFGQSIATGGFGVYGYAPNCGVQGKSEDGIGTAGQGINTGTGVLGTSYAGTGVSGSSQSFNGIGVSGLSATPSGSSHVGGVVGDSATNAGVAGLSKTSTGVYGSATASGGVGGSFVGTGGAAALKVSGTSTFAGTTAFSRSGTLTVPQGSSSVTKTGIGLGAASIVMATIQDTTGNAVSAVVRNVSAKSFTINLVNPAQSAITVAWFIVN